MDPRERIVRRVRALLDEHPERVSGKDALLLVVDLCDSWACIYDGMGYIFEYGRHQGYNLPPYPLAGCGEIREFLADQGVSDVPSWYERIGVGPELYRDFYRYRLLVCMDTGYRRCALPLEIAWFDRLDGDTALDAQALVLARGIVDFIYDGVPLPGATSFR